MGVKHEEVMRKQVKEVLTEKFFEKQTERRDELQDVRREWLLKHQNQLIKEIKESTKQLVTELQNVKENINSKEVSREEFYNLYRKENELLGLIIGESDIEKRTLVLMIERMLEMITKEKKYKHNYLSY